MAIKIYMLRVDNNVVIGFAKWRNHGLGSAILDARNKSKTECEKIIRDRFHSQRHNAIVDGPMEAKQRGMFTFEWLDVDDVITPKQTELALDAGNDRCWTLEERDGFFRPVKIEGELYTADEMKLELLKRAGV